MLNNQLFIRSPKMKFLLLIISILFSGCSTLQNLTVEDVRKDKYLTVKRTYDLTLDQIAKNIYQYNNKCSPLGVPLEIDPSDPSRAIITAKTIGLTNMSIVAVVDFKQIGNQTEVHGYKYTTISHLPRIVWAIDHPFTCYGSNEASN
jgi:hypothetical protein